MNSILDPVIHSRLITDLRNICQTANVLPSYVHSSMASICSATEVDWVRNFRDNQHEGHGLVLSCKESPEDRMMAIAGALLRNFIDARVMSLTTMLDQREHGVMPDCTVLLVPNLYLRASGKTLPSWRVQVLYDTLLARMTSGKPTVVYVEDMHALESEYGRVFADHLTHHYTLAN
jgi:hypothetical protein